MNCLPFEFRYSLITLAITAVPLLPAAHAAVNISDITINEIRIDQPNSDDDEYFELAGASGESLDSLTYLVIGDGTGGSGVIESVTDLTGQVIPLGGFFLAAEDADTLGASPDLITTLNFENSDNVTHLLVKNFTDNNGDDLDTNDDGTLDSIPWEEVIDRIALIEEDNPPVVTEFHYGPPQIGPDGSFVPGHIFRNPNQTGDFQVGAFDPIGGNDTPGASNEATGGEDDPIAASIPQIQGAGHVSPFADQQVSTSGTVTVVDSNGFYLQDAAGDGDIATSDGIFVFTGSAPTVNVGDAVDIVATVNEFTPGGTGTGNLSITQLTSASSISVISSGNALPSTANIGSGGRIPPTENIDDDFTASYNTQAAGIYDPVRDGIDFYESLEGMLVTISNATAVAPTNQFGEIFAIPSGISASGISNRGTLNISPNDFNPERIQVDDDSFSPASTPLVNTGDTLGDVTGVVSYSFGNFEVLATQVFSHVSAGLTAETTLLSGTETQIAVASYNVLNLDPNDADGDTDVADGRFTAIAGQIVNNLNTPDIIALQEIQDNSGSANDGIVAADLTLQMLVDSIVSAGGPAYAFIDNTFIGNNTSGGQPGGNIRTAFLYNSSRVTLGEDTVQTINDPGFAGSRLPLVATFSFNGQDVTLVNNHFSSKGGSAPLFGFTQPTVGDTQEDVTINGSLDERQAQANAVKGFVDGILSNDAEANIIVLGDLNEFEFISPVQTLDTSLNNLTLSLSENERYSFIFQGNSQSLDHILVSDSLISSAEFDAVHVNSEFASTPQTASDHDPLITRLELAQAPVDPLTQLGDLRDQVQQLAGVIRNNDLRKLLRELNRVERAIVQNDTFKATQNLEKFTDNVAKLVRSGALTRTQANVLIDGANKIIATLQNDL